MNRPIGSVSNSMRAFLKKKLPFVYYSVLQVIFIFDLIFSRRSCRFEVRHSSPPFLPSKKLCLFASFSTKSRIEPRVVFYLESLRSAGYEIVFVTTSESINPNDLETLKDSCSYVALRENLTLDFGSWATAMRLVGSDRIKSAEKLLLCNDSVFGPLGSLPDPEMGNEPEIFGITESWQHEPHLQSYFLLMNRAAIQSPFFKKFWSGFRFLHVKRNIIRRYEIGYSRVAKRQGIKLTALIPYTTLTEGRFSLDTPQTLLPNPSPDLWQRLIEKFECPFIKMELIKKTPSEREELERFSKTLSGKWKSAWDAISKE
jgi:lipopolysaccharide biosynthesis protein